MLRVDQVVKNIRLKISEKLIANLSANHSKKYPLQCSLTYTTITAAGHYLIGISEKYCSPLY
jgi:hypothetical protein